MDTVFGRVKLRRGLESEIPVLAIGEPYLAEDTETLWAGTAAGNIQVGGGSGVGAALAAHLADATAAHAASAIGFTPGGGLGATDVQTAIAELDSEKGSSAAVAAAAGIAAGAATAIADHLADATAAHAASAIAFAGGTTYDATHVQEIIPELDSTLRGVIGLLAAETTDALAALDASKASLAETRKLSWLDL